MLFEEQQHLVAQMYEEISMIKTFKGDVHYSLKHLAHLERDIKFYTERLENKYKQFKILSQKYLGISEEEAQKIIENTIKDDI